MQQISMKVIFFYPREFYIFNESEKKKKKDF